jgi:hypothetical protein
MTAEYFLDTDIASDNQDIREPFDYTEWRKDLWEDLSVREITQSAMNFARQKRKERFEHD